MLLLTFRGRRLRRASRLNRTFRLARRSCRLPAERPFGCRRSRSSQSPALRSRASLPRAGRRESRAASEYSGRSSPRSAPSALSTGRGYTPMTTIKNKSGASPAISWAPTGATAVWPSAAAEIVPPGSACGTGSRSGPNKTFRTIQSR